MDLSNKEIDVDFMSSSIDTSETRLTVTITEEIAQGVRRSIGTYKFTLIGESFKSVNDPNLLVALRNKLESLPEPA
jgi:hypothetical protein